MNGLAVFFFWNTLLFGQTLGSAPATFHVQGTISVLGRIGGPDSPGIPGAEVQFESEQQGKTVIADNKGFYQVELPVGLYTMAARLPWHPLLREYRQPPFRVTSSTTITLNGTLYLGRTSCDVKAVQKLGEPEHVLTPEQSTDAMKAFCGGEDFFPIRSGEDGVLLQLYVKYPRRSQQDQVWSYDSDMVAVNYEVPVVVEYNLFTLLAKHVLYDAQHWTLEASDNVVVINEAGVRRRADFMTFKLENGKAVQLR